MKSEWWKKKDEICLSARKSLDDTCLSNCFIIATSFHVLSDVVSRFSSHAIISTKTNDDLSTVRWLSSCFLQRNLSKSVIEKIEQRVD